MDVQYRRYTTDVDLQTRVARYIQLHVGFKNNFPQFPDVTHPESKEGIRESLVVGIASHLFSLFSSSSLMSMLVMACVDQGPFGLLITPLG